MKFGPVLHIYVDVYSQVCVCMCTFSCFPTNSRMLFLFHTNFHMQGNVYVKCATPQIAAAAFNSLNGRFFAGKCDNAVYSMDTGEL